MEWYHRQYTILNHPAAIIALLVQFASWQVPISQVQSCSLGEDEQAACCDTREHGPLGNGKCWTGGRSYMDCCFPHMRDNCSWNDVLQRSTELRGAQYFLEMWDSMPPDYQEYILEERIRPECCSSIANEICFDTSSTTYDMANGYVSCCFPRLYRLMRAEPPAWLIDEVRRVLKGRRTSTLEDRDSFERECATKDRNVDTVYPFCRIKLCTGLSGAPKVTTSCNFSEAASGVGQHGGFHGHLQAITRVLQLLHVLSPQPLEADIFVSVIDMVLYNYNMATASFNSYLERPDVLLLPSEWQINHIALRYYKRIINSDTVPWKEKKPLLFWRGSMSGLFSFWGSGDAPLQEPPAGCSLDLPELQYHNNLNSSTWIWHPRGRLSYLAKYSPDLDAKITRIWRGHSAMDHAELKREGMLDDRRPLEDWTKYRYLIVPDVADRFHYLMWINAVMFFPESAVKMWGVSLLKPWKHYIPLKHDLSDLLDKIAWAKAHDDECEKIADSGSQIARHIFHPEFILLYLYHLLREVQRAEESSCQGASSK